MNNSQGMSEALNTMNTVEFLSFRFEESKELLEKQSAPLFSGRRETSMKQFRKLGIPGRQDENYKYTDLINLIPAGMRLSLTPNSIHLDLKEIFKCDVPQLETNIILLLNGFYYDHYRPLVELSNGAVAGSLAEASRRYPDLVKQHFGQYASPEKEGLVALNGAFSQDGFFLWVPDNTVISKPIQVINIGLWEEDLMIHQHNLIILGKNSEAQIIVCDHTLAPWKFVSNAVSEVYAGDNARFDYVNIQNENNSSARISNLFIHQEEGSQVKCNTISLHGGLIRNNYLATLNGEQCDNRAFGLYFTDRKQHIDKYTFIDHARPSCTSRQLFKGVLDDQATGAFNGRILVRRDAQQTVAYQANNNILLTDEARIHSRPQLEIYADDVKCSHGATVGQLDENALFYLRSRGIGYKEARLMLMYAFADDIISQITVQPLRHRISELVDKRLRGELSRCNNCQINCGNLEC